MDPLGRRPSGFQLGRGKHHRNVCRLVVCQKNGYADVRAYRDHSDPGPFLPRVRVPLLLLNAADDPLINPAEWGAPCHAAIAANPHISMEITPTGGHIGWGLSSGRPCHGRSDAPGGQVTARQQAARFVSLWHTRRTCHPMRTPHATSAGWLAVCRLASHCFRLVSIVSVAVNADELQAPEAFCRYAGHLGWTMRARTSLPPGSRRQLPRCLYVCTTHTRSCDWKWHRRPLWRRVTSKPTDQPARLRDCDGCPGRIAGAPEGGHQEPGRAIQH